VLGGSLLLRRTSGSGSKKEIRIFWLGVFFTGEISPKSEIKN
jgi:hypothetical protein